MRIFFKVCIWVFIIIGVNYSPIFAQDETSTGRIEFELDEAVSNYNVVPAGEKGVLVIYDSGETQGKGKEKRAIWKLIKYDTDLKQEWIKDFNVIKNLDYESFTYQTDQVFVQFKGSGKQSQTQVFKIKVDDGVVSDLAGVVPFSELKVMQPIGNTVFMAGNSMPTKTQIMGRMCLTYFCCFIPVFFGSMNFNVEPLLYAIDFNKNKFNFLGMNIDEPGTITDLNYSDKTNSIHAILMKGKPKTGINLQVKEYNENGKTLSSSNIEPKGGNILLNGKISVLNPHEKILVGTYAKGGKTRKGSMGNNISTSYSGLYSQGIYFTKIEDDKQRYIKFHGFETFKEFYTYLTRNQIKKIEKKKKKGKEVVVSYRLLVHPLFELKDGSKIFLGEAYYPEYHTEVYYTTDANGRTVRQTRQVFDGYRYTHALVANLDNEGNLIWTNSFEIADILTFNLKERVQIYSEGEEILMIYNYGGAIKSKLIKGDQVVDGKRSVEINTGSNTDKVKANWDSDLLHWFDNYFIASGEQKIKDKESKGKKKRKVKYLNKIVFE